MLAPAQPDLRKGMINMVLSCVAFACAWVLIRYTGQSVHFIMIVFARTLVGTLLVLPRLHIHGHSLLRTGQWHWHLVRAVSGLLAAMSSFFAITAAPLADVVAITYAAPLFAALAAVLFLGEVIRARRVLALVVGFIGMLVVIRPGYAELSLGLSAAVLAALAIAVSMTFVKVLARRDSPETIVSLNFVLTLPAAFLIALPYWQLPSWQELGLLTLVGLAASYGQITFARAFAHAETTAILPLDFIRLLLAAVFGFLLFGERLDAWTGLGAGIILTATVYVAHRERLAAKQEALAAKQGP